MEVILDTNFIISCIRKRIDFLEQLQEQGFTVKVPLEVFQEMKDLRLNVKHDERTAIDVALSLFEGRKVKKIKLGHNKVDVGLIAKGKQGVYIATLDREIKRSVPNVVVIFDAQNRVGVAEK